MIVTYIIFKEKLPNIYLYSTKNLLGQRPHIPVMSSVFGNVNYQIQIDLGNLQ